MLYSSKNFVEILNKTILPLYASDHLHRTSSQYENFGAKERWNDENGENLAFRSFP